jgi:hypothetical protein
VILPNPISLFSKRNFTEFTLSKPPLTLQTKLGTCAARKLLM